MKRFLLFALITFALCLCFSLSSSAMNDDGKIVVVLDPGHGGTDPGAVVSGVSEYKNALKLAEYLKADLEATGKFAVYLTRSDNETYLELQERGAIADQYNADICVSLHFNSVNPSSYCGASVCNSVFDAYAKIDLSNQILANLNSYLGLRNNKLLRLEDYGIHHLYWSPQYHWDVYDDHSYGASLSDYYGMIKWPIKYGIPGIIIEHCCLLKPVGSRIASK